MHYTVIATKYDEVVTPYGTQFLSGPDVHNVLLQDLCALDLSEHVAIGILDRIAFHEVANALDPAARHPHHLRVRVQLSVRRGPTGLSRRSAPEARVRQRSRRPPVTARRRTDANSVAAPSARTAAPPTAR